jgi:hypothetical protein
LGIYEKVSYEEERTNKWRIVTVVVCQDELVMGKEKKEKRGGVAQLYIAGSSTPPS